MKVQLIKKQEIDGEWFFIKVNGSVTQATQDYEKARSIFNWYVENQEKEEIVDEVTDEKLQSGR